MESLRSRFSTRLGWIVRNIDNHKANWKVIARINGEIEAVSGPAAHARPRAQEWTVWEGTAADKGEALQNAEIADSRVDLEWMCIRHERDPIRR
jgi:phosphodiesterase/alkaline phosphatase D-like protein